MGKDDFYEFSRGSIFVSNYLTSISKGLFTTLKFKYNFEENCNKKLGL